MIIVTTTLEEEMANMKAILEKLTRDNEEKDSRIKFQEEKITKLTRKLKNGQLNLPQRTQKVRT